jgi:hypothetical protein
MRENGLAGIAEHERLQGENHGAVPGQRSENQPSPVGSDGHPFGISFGVFDIKDADDPLTALMDEMPSTPTFYLKAWDKYCKLTIPWKELPLNGLATLNNFLRRVVGPGQGVAEDSAWWYTIPGHSETIVSTNDDVFMMGQHCNAWWKPERWQQTELDVVTLEMQTVLILLCSFNANMIQDEDWDSPETRERKKEREQATNSPTGSPGIPAGSGTDEPATQRQPAAGQQPTGYAGDSDTDSELSSLQNFSEDDGNSTTMKIKSKAVPVVQRKRSGKKPSTSDLVRDEQRATTPMKTRSGRLHR